MPVYNKAQVNPSFDFAIPDGSRTDYLVLTSDGLVASRHTVIGRVQNPRPFIVEGKQPVGVDCS